MYCFFKLYWTIFNPIQVIILLLLNVQFTEENQEIHKNIPKFISQKCIVRSSDLPFKTKSKFKTGSIQLFSLPNKFRMKNFYQYWAMAWVKIFKDVFPLFKLWMLQQKNSSFSIFSSDGHYLKIFSYVSILDLEEFEIGKY